MPSDTSQSCPEQRTGQLEGEARDLTRVTPPLVRVRLALALLCSALARSLALGGREKNHKSNAFVNDAMLCPTLFRRNSKMCAN